MMQDPTDLKIQILRKDIEESIKKLYQEVAQTLTRAIVKIGGDIEQLVQHQIQLEKRIDQLEGKGIKLRNPETEGREL